MEFQNIVRTVLRLIFAAGGLILLFHGSFSKMQFEDSASLKGMSFIILSLGVGFFVYKPLKCNDMFEKLCDMHFLVHAVVKLLLLGLFSMVIFFIKYPGLKIHRSEAKRSRKVYDLLGIGSISFFALVISCERQHGEAGFGIFEFMLELTMDASMEIPSGHHDGSRPNLWYMVGAYVYCFLLLIIRAYGNSLSTEQGISNSVGSQEILLQDQNDQPPGTDLDAIGLERESENNHGRQANLGNYEVDGLRNRRSLLRAYGNSLSTEQGISDSDQPPGTDLEAMDRLRKIVNLRNDKAERLRRRVEERIPGESLAYFDSERLPIEENQLKAIFYFCMI